jgi:hypothetical protein
MPSLVLTDFNIITAVLGGFITVFGLVSYLFKERFYLSEACKYASNQARTYLTSRGDLVGGWHLVQSSCCELDPASRLRAWQ